MFIYADNAATTKISKSVLDSMLPIYTEIYGNPSSLHKTGQIAKEYLEKSRNTIADIINCQPREIFFTSGGSEADNIALISGARMGEKRGKKHIISTKFEHHAILHTLKKLETEGFEITLLDVNENGIVNPSDVKDAIRNDTALVSIMMANNEIGTIQPIKQIGQICKEKGILFHTDAVQGIAHLKIDVEELGVNMLSVSAHKFYGPKGTGFLYAKRGVVLTNIIEGGAQERGKRAGTENLPAIVGMATALKDATDNLEKNNAVTTKLRNRLVEGLIDIPHSVYNGDKNNRLPGTVNFCFEGIEGESLLLLLDEKGIEASSGSACASGSLDPSHVLLSIGLPVEVAHGSLRLSINENNTEEEIDYIIKSVKEIVPYLRSISPVWESLENGTEKHLI